MKRQFELSEDEVRELEQAQVRCKDGATRTRYLGVRLYGTGYPVEEILKRKVPMIINMTLSMLFNA